VATKRAEDGPRIAAIGAANSRAPTFSAARRRSSQPQEAIMRKLRLNPDALEVQSFETAPPEPERGTVDAHQQTNPNANTCDPLEGTCFGFTCFRTCICTGPANPGTCGPGDACI
jgi:hypothetical protein